MRVGFAGLGRMGVPMARNLCAAGHALTVWNRTVTKAQEDGLLHLIANGCGLAGWHGHMGTPFATARPIIF